MNPAMDATKCQETVMHNYWRSQCQTKPKVVRDGKPYCAKHDPDPQYTVREIWYRWWCAELEEVIVVAYSEHQVQWLPKEYKRARREDRKGFFQTREAAIEDRRRYLTNVVSGYEETVKSYLKVLDKFNQEYPQGETNGKTE